MFHATLIRCCSGFFVIKVMSTNMFFPYVFFMLQILNFNVVDIVFRCCNGTYNLNSGYLLRCTVAVKFQQTVIDASDRS
jgi:hypothetical protein